MRARLPPQPAFINALNVIDVDIDGPRKNSEHAPMGLW